MGVRRCAEVLPAEGRILEVLDDTLNHGLRLHHDVRTQDGENCLRETMNSISNPVRDAVNQMGPALLTKTTNLRRAFDELAGTLPADLRQTSVVLQQLAANASSRQHERASSLLPRPLRLPFDTDEELTRVKQSYQIAGLAMSKGVASAKPVESHSWSLTAFETEECIELLASWVYNPWLFQELNARLPLYAD